MSLRILIALFLGQLYACGPHPSEVGSDASSDAAPPAACGALGTCYVAPTGDDGHPGTSDEPLRTISRCSQTFAGAAGTCIVRAGDYHETVKVASNLTIQAYDAAGTPERVAIHGADVLAALTWDQVRPHVWRTTHDLSSSARRFEPQLAVDGIAFVEARWPNLAKFEGQLDRTSRRSAQAGTGAAHIVDAGLPPNLIGGIVQVTGGLQYGAHTGVITAQGTGTIDYTPDQAPIPSDLAASPGSPYFVSNLDSLLDTAGEWFYDASDHSIELYLPGATTPGDVTIEAKLRDYALDLAGTSNATVKNIELFMASVHMDPSSTDNLLQGLRGVYVTHNVRNLAGPYIGAVYSTATTSTGIEISGVGNTLVDSSVKYSSGHGISVFGNHNEVRNNTVFFTDYSSVYAYSLYLGPGTANNRIEHNTLATTGRSGLGLTSPTEVGATLQATTIAFNDISGFGLTTEDYGGMYFSNIDGATPSSGPNITDYTRIVGNYVHDAYSGPTTLAHGIYFDCASRGFVITHNIVANTRGAALEFSTCGGGDGGGYYMTANNNTFGSGQNASIGTYAPSSFGLANAAFSNNVLVVAGGICTGTACNPAADYGAGGSANWHGDPGFASGGFQLASGSGAIGTAAPIWTDTAFGIDWRCPLGVAGCANPAAPSYGAYNTGGYVFTFGSTIH